MDAPEQRARDYLERRTSIAMLATTPPGGPPETCLLIAPQFTEDGHVAGGEEAEVAGRVFRNLRQSPRATLLILDPIMDPRARDGVRLVVEFLGAEVDGPGLEKMRSWLTSFAPGRHVVRRLLFKVIETAHYRPARDDGPVLLS